MDPVLRNVLITAGFIILITVIRKIATKVITNKLTGFIINNDAAGFDNLIGKWYAKLFLMPFNMDYLKMNSYLVRNNDRLINEQFEHFDNVRLSDAQKNAVYTNAFSYYVGKNDRKKSKKYYDELMVICPDEAVKKSLSRIYNVYIEDGYKYLEETIADLERAEEAQKASLNSLIAMMYKNKGNDSEAQKYYEAASESLRKLEEEDNG